MMMRMTIVLVAVFAVAVRTIVVMNAMISLQPDLAAAQ